MTKPNSTEIVFVVDRSGSMGSIAEAMSRGFDEFIRKQKLVPGECRVTATQFDHEHEEIYTSLPLDQVPAYKLVPRGNTALLDAIGRTILQTGARLSAMQESERPGQVLFVIITDGQENASREFGRQRIFDMITEQRTKYSWEFVFLGANQDAIVVGESLGVSATNAVTYDANVVGTRAVMDCLTENVAVYRNLGLGTMNNLFNQASYDAAKSSDPKRK